MKKFIAAFASFAICATLMAGCGAKIPANTVFKADDLANKKIGVQLGTTGDIYASGDFDGKDGHPSATVEQFKGGHEAVLSLSQGKLDAVIIDNEPAKVFVKQNKGLKILDEEYISEDYALCIKKGSELTSKINAALRDLKADGTIDKILKNYIGDDTTVGKNPYKSPEGIQRNGKLIMATNAAFPPYEYMQGENIVGIDADIAQAVADKLGMSLEINNMDFDAIIGAVTAGKADFGAAGMTVTDVRKKSVDFTDSYATGKQVIIVREK
ncbi:MAG: transporter substrate-binding domain-containing protein [Oscillospiraceae bacterium]